MKTLLGVTAALVLLCSTAQAAPTPPKGYADDLVVQLPNPTAVGFLPSGQLLVAVKRGQVYRVQEGVPTSPLDLAARVCSDGDRGLLGLAVDPAFGTSPYVYVLYTFARGGNCSSPVNRLSRFTVGANGQIEAASESVVLDDTVPAAATNNGGALAFGRDGSLYAAFGGKIVRFAGGTPTVYATGFRDPSSISFDTNGRMFVNDSGTVEEVNQVSQGGDYANARPAYSYPHANGCGDISGGTFVPSGVWSGYAGQYLFADAQCGRISSFTGTTASTFAIGLGPVTFLTFGPSGRSQTGALYYGTNASGGEVRRISVAVVKPTTRAQICTVPRLKGLTITAARAALNGNGCSLGKVVRVYSSKVRAGLIVSQKTLAGKKLKRGTKIAIVVSRGPRP